MAAILQIGRNVLIPHFQRRRALELLKNASRTSGALSQGRFSPIWSPSSLGSPYSAGLAFSRSRASWNRKRLPVYGSFASNIPMSRVYVPGTITFPWENPDEIWKELPSIKYARARNTSLYQQANMPPPDYEIWTSMSGGGRRKPPPAHRRRHDSKVPGWYNRFLATVGRTYGRLSEYGDTAAAFYWNNDPVSIATALALENAIDYAYGAKARFQKEHIYGTYWNLPFGIDAATRFWR